MSELLSKRRSPAGKTFSRHPLYARWRNMLVRCQDPESKEYSNYGGRGIRVCERWEVFANFTADMGSPPFHHAQLDRIDNNGNYEPGNVRWTTARENSRNTRRNRILAHNGEALPLIVWSERTGIDQPTLKTRLRTGMGVDKALTLPLRPGVRQWGGAFVEVPPGLKYCRACGSVKPLEEFYPRKTPRGGAVESKCKGCSLARRNALHAAVRAAKRPQ